MNDKLAIQASLTTIYAMGFKVKWRIPERRRKNYGLLHWANYEFPKPQKEGRVYGLSYDELLMVKKIKKPKNLWDLDHPNGGYKGKA